jgi:hypothetical protein
VDNKWSLVGGIMSIVSGGFGILGGLALMVVGVLFAGLMRLADSASSSRLTPEQFGTIFGLIYGGMGLFLLLFGVLALVGGINAVKKKHWGLALAGAVGGTLSFFPVGVMAVVFTAMAKPEFEANRDGPPAAASRI